MSTAARPIAVVGIGNSLLTARGVPSRVAVHATRQSAPLDSRASLEAAVRAAAARLGVDWAATGRLAEPASPIARPTAWGGYRLWPARAELWVEGSGRLQDRALWTRALEEDGDGFRGGRWQMTRLATSMNMKKAPTVQMAAHQVAVNLANFFKEISCSKLTLSEKSITWRPRCRACLTSRAAYLPGTEMINRLAFGDIPRAVPKLTG